MFSVLYNMFISKIFNGVTTLAESFPLDFEKDSARSKRQAFKGSEHKIIVSFKTYLITSNGELLIA